MGDNMQKVVIFEGCDKVGKTEMARELAKRLEIPYFKNKSEWRAFSSDKEYFVKALRYGDPYFYTFLRDTNTSVILDRSYPSEWVYSKVYDRKTDDDALTHIDSLAASFGVKIVIPYRTSYSGLKDDIHDIGEYHLQKLSDTYETFAKWTKCDVLRFCIDSEDLEWEMNTIQKFLKKGT
jgi:thymidylate kinase